MTLGRSIGGSTGSTSIFRRCGVGHTRSSRDGPWKRGPAATFGYRLRRMNPRAVSRIATRRPCTQERGQRGSIPNRLDWVHWRVHRRRIAGRPSRAVESAGARKRPTGGRSAPVAIVAIAFRFPEVFRLLAFADQYFLWRPDEQVFRLVRGGLSKAGRDHRFDHPLRGVTES